MERRASLAVSACWLLVLPLASACGEDSTPIDDDGDSTADDGINSISDSMSAGSDEADTSAGDGPTSTEAGSVDGTGAPSCMDGAVNEDETDVDCGGATCEPCGSGLHCLVATDCVDAVCEDDTCQEPSCYDEVANGNEEGVDCGGPCPNSCGSSGCDEDNDCPQGEFCLETVCTPSACDNRVQDTDETDVDCGGNDCPGCDADLMCDGDGDCASEVCDGGTWRRLPAVPELVDLRGQLRLCVWHLRERQLLRARLQRRRAERQRDRRGLWRQL
jgi:hypothetical protein